MTRSLGGALIPLSGQALYRSLGLGWGNTLFASLNICLIPMALVVYFLGHTLRSTYMINP